MNRPRVLLLNMPFVSIERPAIGISLLKACLAEKGIGCDIGYANLLFAELVGKEAYELVDNKLSLALFPGDWLFAQYAFGQSLDLDSYAATLRANCEGQANFDLFMELRDQIGPFLKLCMERWDIQRYNVVGFTTSFQQNLASLVLAGLIRERFPEKILVFGGANCEGVMGMQLHKSFEWVDYVCTGEADYTFSALVKRLSAGQPINDLPGLIYRDNGQSRRSAVDNEYVHKMDDLPDPDFRDYFEAVDASPLRSSIQPILLIESSRGCWWGAKSHCAFCGLNGSSMAFRAKSAERTLAEIERQVERHGIRHFHVVDNIIPGDYFRTLLPMLKERQMGISFFYETKSNLTRTEIRLLRDAGVIAIQPGIESLSTHVLQVMKKGVTAIQNIQLLKWCKEYGVEVAWNFLYGFPGERSADYEEVAAYISAVPHLRAPGSAKPIRLDRFSPYFDRAESYGIVNIRPFSAYQLVYPFSPAVVSNLAYYFEFDYADGRKAEEYATQAIERAEAWAKDNARMLYRQYCMNGDLLLVDARKGGEPTGYLLTGMQRDIYEFCEEIRSTKSIIEMVSPSVPGCEDLEPHLHEFLQQMVDLQLMVRENQKYLSIAISENCPPVLVSSRN